MKGFFSILIIAAFILSGCKAAPEQTGETPKEVTQMFTERDNSGEYSEEGVATIEFTNSGVNSQSDAVTVEGTTVTIKKDGVYVINGSCEDGKIVVDAPATAKPQLVLKGVNITSKTSAPIYIVNGDKVFITLEDGTENTLANGGSFIAADQNNIDSVIFSKQDITINGGGTLNVTSPAGHGIVSKDDLVITGGVYSITTASHGIDANDSIRLSGAEINVTAGKDGIHAENSDDTTLGFVYIKDGSYTISAEGDGISASAYMQIEDGNFDIITGGGSENASKQSSDNWGGFQGGGGGMGRPGDRGPGGPGGMGGMMRPTSSTTTTVTDEASTSIKGLKAATEMQISGGNFKIDSADDAIHSNGSITVSGGSFEISTGDDGFHADQKLSITNGKVNITESYEGLEALDIDLSGGDIKLVASDDGLNAAGGNDQSGFGGMRGDEQFGGRGGMGGGPGGMGSASNGSIVITGGTLYAKASGDGIDANGTLEIKGGFTTVCGPTQGDTATLDYDASAVITGGTFIGSGAAGMAQTFSDAKQGLLSLSVGNQAAKTKVTVTDKSGKTIIETTPELSFAVIIISSPDIVSGETYTVNIGSDSGEFTAK